MNANKGFNTNVLVQGSCFVIKKRNSKHPIASFLCDNIHNHRSNGRFLLYEVKKLQRMINLLLPKKCPIQLK